MHLLPKIRKRNGSTLLMDQQIYVYVFLSDSGMGGTEMPDGNGRKRWIGELGSLPPTFTCLFSGTGAHGANYAVSTQHRAVSTEEMLLVHWGESKLQESCSFNF